MKKIQQNFNTITNIFILILLFFGGLSYADTNGIWQFANDTRPGVFGLDEGAGIGNNYTFINPVYFNLGLHINGFSTFTQLNGNLFYANNATIASQLTLSGFNCGVNSKLRTDAFGNVVCSQDNINDSVHNLATMKTAVSYDFHNLGGIDRVNDGVYNLATMKTAVSYDFHNLGGIDKDTFITTQTCAAGKILKSVGKNSKICIPLKWAAVTGKPIPQNCKKGFYMTDINIGGGTIKCKKLPTTGITTQTCPTGQVLTSVGTNSSSCVSLPTQGITTEVDPKVGTLTNGKWCTSNGVTVNCNSAAPSSGITGITVGQGLSGGGTSGIVNINLNQPVSGSITGIGWDDTYYQGSGQITCGVIWGLATCTTSYGMSSLNCPLGSTKIFLRRDPTNIITKTHYLCIQN